MKRVVGLAAVALAVVLAVAFAGFAPADGSTDADGSAGAVESTQTATSTASAGTATADSTEGGVTAEGTAATATTPTEPRFAFVIDRIEECGRTCRDVTTTLENDGAAASSVTVSTRIYAGNGTDGEMVWEGTEPVGDLGAGESYTTTKRVDLSFGGALAVRGADGWITVRTTVRSDERTVTFTQQRDVL